MVGKTRMVQRDQVVRLVRKRNTVGAVYLSFFEGV